MSPRQSAPCHPATSAADAPAHPKAQTASPDDLKARLKVTRLANYGVSNKTAPARCVPQDRGFAPPSSARQCSPRLLGRERAGFSVTDKSQGTGIDPKALH